MYTSIKRVNKGCPAGVIFLGDIYIKPEQRGKGYGSSLLQLIIDDANVHLYEKEG